MPRERFTAELLPAATVEYLRTLIHPKTVLIGWGHYDIDLRILRKFADIHGNSDFLPLPCSSPPGISLLKAVLPGLPCWKLEFVFPALFPNDRLVGQNHFADADALMCRKVVSYCLEAFSLNPNLPEVGPLQATLRHSWNRAAKAQSGAKRECYVSNNEV